MKNPFVKKDDSSLWIAVLFGALTTGTLTYLWVAKRYAQRQSKLSDALDDVQQRAADYLTLKAGKPKKHKSDIHDLEHLAHLNHEE